MTLVQEWSLPGAPPPHIGWWNASNTRDRKAWRWWDGIGWSLACYEWQSIGTIRDSAGVYANQQGAIMWTNRWPANARISRVDPRVPIQMPNIIELDSHPVTVRTHTTMEEALIAAEAYIAASVDRDGRMRPQDCRTLCLVRHALGRDIVTGRPL